MSQQVLEYKTAFCEIENRESGIENQIIDN